MKKTLLAIFISSSFFSQAQNLVPNPSFENLSSCPTSQAQLNLATPWDVAPNTGSATPDLFNGCNLGQFGVPSNVCGYQNARTGISYAGFYTHGATDCREYVQVQLISALIAGVTYSVEFYVSPCEEPGIAVDGMGLYFSVGPASGSGNFYPLPFTPQISNPVNSIISDTSGWTLVSGLYTALGGEDYITIGNFKDDASTNTLVLNSLGWSRGYYRLDDVSVTAQSAPVALFSAPNHICPGTCTGFNNLSINATSYEWTFSGANPNASTDANPQNICYNTPGTYSVTLIATNANGCDTLILNNYITVYPSPPPQGIAQSGDTLFANAGAVSYQWYLSGNIIPGATGYFYVAATSGDYNVVATDVNGCEVEAAIFDVIASIRFNTSDLELNVYPNPVTEKLYVNSNSLNGISPAVSIFNVLGEIVPADQVQIKYVENLTVIDVRALASALYFIEVHADGKVLRTKFFKE